MLVYLTKNCFNLGNCLQLKKKSLKYQYISTVQKTEFLDLETYFDDISDVRCCELDTGDR